MAAAQRAHVQVSTIAFGTQNGTVTINGIARQVPADDQALRQIADSTGGSFHTAHSEQELSSVYQDIGSSVGYTNEERDISAWLIGGALVLLLVTSGLSLAWFSRLP